MGSDVTKGGLEWQLRSHKHGAKIQQQALAKGIDPKDVNVVVNEKGHPADGTQHPCTLRFLFILYTAHNSTYEHLPKASN